MELFCKYLFQFLKKNHYFCVSRFLAVTCHHKQFNISNISVNLNEVSNKLKRSCKTLLTIIKAER